MVRRRLVERRLPHELLMNVRFIPGAGQMCDACGENIAPDHMAMIGAPSTGGQTCRLHALCFRIWENERRLLDWLDDLAGAERLLSRNQVLREST